MEQKIRFRDLSGPLKTAIVSAYIIGSLYSIYFLVGFIEGILLVQ